VEGQGPSRRVRKGKLSTSCQHQPRRAFAFLINGFSQHVPLCQVKSATRQPYPVGVCWGGKPREIRGTGTAGFTPSKVGRGAAKQPWSCLENKEQENKVRENPNWHSGLSLHNCTFLSLQQDDCRTGCQMQLWISVLYWNHCECEILHVTVTASSWRGPSLLHVIQHYLAFHVDVGPDERCQGGKSFAVKLKGEWTTWISLTNTDFETTLKLPNHWSVLMPK